MPRNKDPNDRLPEKVEKVVGREAAFRYDPEVKQKALVYFLHLLSPAEIAKKMGIEEKTIIKWTKEQHWVSSQKKVIKSLYGNLYALRKDSLDNIHGMGLALIERFLAKQLSSDAPMTMKDAQALMGLLAQAGKMIRLEEGKPTEITKRISIEEAKQKVIELVRSDPFEEFKDQEDTVLIDETGNLIKH